MAKKLLAIAVLTIAVMAPAAAIAAPGGQAYTAEERAAPMPLADLVPAYAAQPAGAPIGSRGDRLEVALVAVSPAPIASPLLVAAREAWVSADRRAIVWHLRL